MSRSTVRRIRKALTATVGASLLTIPLVWDGVQGPAEAAAILTAWATAFGVYRIPNAAPARRRPAAK